MAADIRASHDRRKSLLVDWMLRTIGAADGRTIVAFAERTCAVGDPSMGAAAGTGQAGSEGGTAKPTGSWPFAQVSHIWVSAVS